MNKMRVYHKNSTQKYPYAHLCIAFQNWKSSIKYHWQKCQSHHCVLPHLQLKLSIFILLIHIAIFNILFLFLVIRILKLFQFVHKGNFVQLGNVLQAAVHYLISFQHLYQLFLSQEILQILDIMSAIDKIVIYGVANPERLKITDVLSNNIKVTTLQAYSKQSFAVNKKNEIDFEMWAYPDGIKIYNSNLEILNDSDPQFSFFESTDIISQVVSSSQSKAPPEYIYSFVLTDYDLNRTYCTCIIWNQRCFIKDDRDAFIQNSSKTNSLIQSMNKGQQKMLFQPKQKYSLAIPKCKLETMINNPLILDTSTIPVFVPKAMIVCSKTPCIQLQRNLLKYYHMKMIKQQTRAAEKTIKIPRLFENQLNQLIKNYGYSKAQRIFDFSKSETIQKMQLKLLKMTFKDAERDKSTGFLNVQTTKLKQFFISSLFTLPQQPKKSFILSENGIPIASKMKSETVFQLPKVFDAFSEYENFQKLSFDLLPLPVPQFIQLWKCILLEKQIIIFSNSQMKSIILSQLMLHLIQPIKWENIYIPFLPFHLAHHIEAIGGYIIGMSRIHMDYMLQEFQMKNKVVVDMEHKTILQEGGKEVIELPQQIKSFLQKSLTRIVQSYEQSRRPNRGLINYLITNKQEHGPKQKIKTTQSFFKHWLQIQKLFFHALVMLFNNFIPFIVKKQDGIIFVKTEEYLNILEDKLHRNFMKEISKTMVFIRLCENHVEQSQKCAWVQKNLGQLFVYSHDILSHRFVVNDSDVSKGLAQEQKINVNELKSDAEKMNNTKKRAFAWTVQDLLLDHEKYYQYIEYLFEKNLNQILDTVVSTIYYLNEEQKKYKILNSQDQFQSFEALESIELPADFGKKGKPQNAALAIVEKGEKQLQYKKIYQKIESKQVAKSKKNKKYGDKDEEQLYEQFGKSCTDLKIQRFVIKYLKYMQMNQPQRVIKVASRGRKRQKSNSGIINWFWELVNPPESSRGKQELEIKSKLQRKMTIQNIKIERALNLGGLFEQREEQIETKDEGIQYLSRIGELEQSQKQNGKKSSKNLVNPVKKQGQGLGGKEEKEQNK